MATRWADFDGAKPAAQTPYVGMVDGVDDEGGEGEGGKGGGGGGGEQKQTDREAYFNLCRGSLGPGMLALPHVFSLVGWSLGMLLLALLSAAIWLNMVLLVEVRHFLGRSTQQLRRAPAAAWFSPHRLGADVRTYPEIGRAVWGRAGHAAVECVLVALELGICTVYFVFLSTNLGIVLGDGAATVRGHRLLMAALFAPLAALTQLRFVRPVHVSTILGNAQGRRGQEKAICRTSVSRHQVNLSAWPVRPMSPQSINKHRGFRGVAAQRDGADGCLRSF